MNEILILFAFGFVLFMIIFILSHLEPLTKEQLEQLALKLRMAKINNHYLFDKREYITDKDFKIRMNPYGGYYVMNETLFSIPSVVASLLKHKRHEWIIIAFEKNKRIEKIWLNKGCNESTVSLRYNIEHFIETNKDEGYSTFLIFHNHPNSNPYKYSMNKPSEIDLETAESRGKILIKENINLNEFVCKRGKYYLFFQGFCDSFFPIEPIFAKIEQKNGKSTMDNLSLHFKRVF